MKKIAKKLLTTGLAILFISQAHGVGPFEQRVTEEFEKWAHSSKPSLSEEEKSRALHNVLRHFCDGEALPFLASMDLCMTYGVVLPEEREDTVKLDFLREHLLPTLLEKGVTPYAIAKHLMTDPVASLPQAFLMTSTLMRKGGPIGDEQEGLNQFFGGILGYGPAETAGYREVSKAVGRFLPHVKLAQLLGLTNHRWQGMSPHLGLASGVEESFV